jgi:hypothetical protein
LLDAWLDQPKRTERSTRTFAAMIIAGLVAVLVLAGLGGYFLARAILGL